MTRIVTVGAAQMGPIPRRESRAQGAALGDGFGVVPECRAAPFLPPWQMTDQDEIDSYFEREMPGPETRPLFDESARLGVGFHLGYAELAHEDGRGRRFNTAILVDKTGRTVGKYRKIHLPGWDRPDPEAPYQNLEKLYFEVGNL